MSTKHPYSNSDALLREQMNQFLPDVPEGVWESMEQDLDQLNQDMQFDEAIRQGAEQFQPGVPQGVWEGVQANLGTGAGMSGAGLSIATKWVIGTLVGLGIGGGSIWYYQSAKQNKLPETTAVETIQVPQQNQNEEPVAEEITANEERGQIEAENGTAETQHQPHNAPVAHSGTNPHPGSPGYSGGSTEGTGQESAASAVPPVNSSDGATVPEAGGNSKSGQAFASFRAGDTMLCPGNTYRIGLNCDLATDWEVMMNGIRVKSSHGESTAFEYDVIPGVYLFTYKWKNQTGRGAFNQLLNVPAKPDVQIISPMDLGDGVYHFEVSSDAAVVWYLDGNRQAEGRNCDLKFYDEQPTDHRIIAVATNASGCSDSAVKEFRNNAVVKVSELNMPGSFSPNGDGINDAYRVVVEGTSYFRMLIYNSDNQMVYVSEDPTQGWDGRDRNKGNTINEGTYTCIVEYALAGGERQTRKAMIQLITSKERQP